MARAVEYSKERRVDPQIVVGLLVDQTGFSLEIGCCEDNPRQVGSAPGQELYVIPIVKEFQDRHGVTHMVIVADAETFSDANLTELDDAKLRFIVGSRQPKAPNDLATFFTGNGTHTDVGQLVDSLTPRAAVELNQNRTLTCIGHVWSSVGHPEAWQAVWQYPRKRAVRGRETLKLQRDRAMCIISGESEPKSARFMRTQGSQKVFDESSCDKAVGPDGRKCYVTHIGAEAMTTREVVGSYNDVEDRPASPPDLPQHAKCDRGARVNRVHRFSAREVPAGSDGAVIEEDHH